MENEYNDLRALILQASACKKPADDSALAKVLIPLQNDIAAISRAKEANRKDRAWMSHMNFIAEGATAVGWVAVVSIILHVAHIYIESFFVSTGTETCTISEGNQGFY